MANPFTKIRSKVANDIATGNQAVQDVDVSSTGDVLVSWLNPDSRLQIFDANGNDVSPEIVIPNIRPPVWLQDGSFAALNFSGGQAWIDRYDRTGTLLGSSPHIAATAAYDLVELSGGGVVLAYLSGGQSHLVGQRLDSNLQPVGSSFDIDSNLQNEHRFEALTDGGFLYFQYGLAASATAQQFAADGSKIGVPIVLTGELMGVEALHDGGFVVTVSRLHGDSSSYGIVGRIYNEDGTPRTGEFLVNTTEAGEQSWSNVAAVDNDLFLVTWGPNNEFGQLFDMIGRKVGREILLENGAGGSPDGGGGWSIDSSGGDGFVTASASSGDVVLSYWQIDRADILLGTRDNDSFNGGGAADRIMVGYTGNDIYFVDSAGDEIDELDGEGNDTVLTNIDYHLGAGASVELLATTDDNGTSPLQLFGNFSFQTIRGNAGDNVLDGGEGNGDTLIGLAGNDYYFIRSSSDKIQEAAGNGEDRVFAAVSYVLSSGQSVEIMSTTLNAGTAPIDLTGNKLSQVIYGNAGDNRLSGGGGGDGLVGFGGNDSYFVGDSRDIVREGAHEGNDRVYASVSYALASGEEIETLSTDNDNGTAPLALTGNELAQVILGNNGANQLTSHGGGDILIGLGGDDSYFVSDTRDLVHELSGAGADRVFSSVSYALRAGESIEMLTTDFNAGTSAINLTGNELAQGIYGNAGNNQLNGGGGADSLVGFGGDDWYFIVDGRENVFESAGGGADRIFAGVDYHLQSGAEVELITTDFNTGSAAIDLTGNEFAQTIFGNAGNNILDGGAGKDILVGNGGADIFLFSTALNTPFGTPFDQLSSSANVDRIDGFAFDDRIGLDAARFGLTPGALPPGAFALGTTATEADDRILYDQASGTLMFDPDGNGSAPAQVFAVMGAPFSLDASYFVVI
jgi:Ca2+-binding RTX toxin-like protein